MTPVQKLKAILDSKSNFLLICHEHPDGDSIGSLLAMGGILDHLGKHIQMVSKDPLPEVFKFLDRSSQIAGDFLLGDFEVVILLDNGDFKRTGFCDRLAQLQKKHIPIINIDHHPKNDLWRIASLNYVDLSASSTCEIIFKLAIELNFPINAKIATALLTGIFTDTGGFQHSNTSEAVLELSAELLKRGAKLKEISKNIAQSHSVAMLKLWGIALNRLIINKKIGLIYSVITKNDIAEAGAEEAEVSGLVNLINSIPSAQLALLIYETSDGKIKGSFRTESETVDLSRLANLFGGGGHKKASGFTLAGSLKQIKGKWQVV